MNRCTTYFGKRHLAEWMKQPLTEKDSIVKRQEAIRELAGLPNQFQSFYLLGQRKQGKGNDIRNLEQLGNDSNHFAGNHFWRVLIWAVPLLWVLLTGGYLLGFIA